MFTAILADPLFQYAACIGLVSLPIHVLSYFMWSGEKFVDIARQATGQPPVSDTYLPWINVSAIALVASVLIAGGAALRNFIFP